MALHWCSYKEHYVEPGDFDPHENKCDSCSREYQRRRQHERQGQEPAPPENYISLREAAERLGYTRGALNQKILRHDWLADRLWRRGKRGQIYVPEDGIYE
jgi:hypothetical protein